MSTTKIEIYSNWTYEPLAFISHHAVPQISRLLPSNTRHNLYNFLSNWEESMLAEPTYRKRTWFGLNGVDQYDLVADCQHAMSKYL
jgi:hypothetical protein